MIDLCLVCLSYPPDKLGSEGFYVYNVFQHIKNKFNSIVLTRFWSKKIQGQDKVVQVQTISVKKIGTYIWARRVANLIKKVYKPKFVHAFGFRAAYASHLAKKRYSVTLHMSDVNYITSSSLMRKISKSFLAAAEDIFLTNEASRNLFLRYFPDLMKKSRVMPLGVDTDRFSPYIGTGDLKEKLGLRGKVILHVSGELNENQAVDKLIDAFHILRGKTDISLVIIGKPSGSFREKYTKIRHANPDIVFLQYVPHDEIHKYYGLADVFITLPLKYDGVGLSILEAMAAGKVVVSTPSPVYKETGAEYIITISDPSDPFKIAETLKSVIIDPKFMKNMGYKAREYVLRNYSNKKLISDLIDYYTSKVKDTSRNASELGWS